MKRPRCGVPDQFGVRVKANLRRRKRYTLTGKTWNSHHLTFRYGSSWEESYPAPLRETQNSFPRRGLACYADGPSSQSRKPPSWESKVSFKHLLLGPFLAPASCRLDWLNMALRTFGSVWLVSRCGGGVRCSAFTPASDPRVNLIHQSNPPLQLMVICLHQQLSLSYREDVDFVLLYVQALGPAALSMWVTTPLRID